MTLDPSYWMPALMRDLSDAFELERLAMARATALRWLAATAETQLAPDWILAHGASWGAPPAGFSTNTGYEAVRVPLYLCMSGLGDHPMVQRFRRAYAAAGMTDAGVPIVMDPHSGAAIQRDQSPGYAAVAALAGCTLPQSGGISGIPVFTADQPYYPATLHLFALIAQIEGFPKCLPI